MDKIWANRLIAGSKVWSEVPEKRKESVRSELESRLASGEITEDRLKEILGE